MEVFYRRRVGQDVISKRKEKIVSSKSLSLRGKAGCLIGRITSSSFGGGEGQRGPV